MTPTLAELAQVNDAQSQLYREQLANQEPEVTQAPGMVDRKAKYVFRTKPGTVRSQRIRIPGVPAVPVGRYLDKPEYRDHLRARYEGRYPASERELHDRVREKVGGFFIEFTHLPRKQECVFQTDDDEVAQFVRDTVKASGNPYVYESVEAMPLRSLYTEKTFPNTPDGQAALYAHDLEYRRKSGKE
jgi:hypothetical protein